MKRTFYKKLKKNTRNNIRILFTVFILCLLSLVANWWYQSHINLNNSVEYRNNRITDALSSHPVQTFLLDEKRHTLATLKTPYHTATVSLKECTKSIDNNNVIDTAAFQNKSFAYLLTYNHLSKAEANCKLQAIIDLFGRPNLSTTIIGTLEHPGEQLLFYDHGINKTAAANSHKLPASVSPITLNELRRYSPCTHNTVLNVVAHQDDDLLFINPDLQRDISAGKCVTSIYMTAGDAGNNQFYWLGREQGTQAAYSFMTTENDDLWISRIVKLAENEYVTIASPKTNNKISLIFVHLPDGSPTGIGFKSSKNQSLLKLTSNKIPLLNTVDGQSVYTLNQLTNVISTLMNYYKPTVIRSQSQILKFTGNPYKDHSDHINTGEMAAQAFLQYANQKSTPFYAYIGYPIYASPPNLTDVEIIQKEATFLQYGAHDDAVCHTHEDCVNSKQSYGAYLTRMYKVSN